MQMSDPISAVYGAVDSLTRLMMDADIGTPSAMVWLRSGGSFSLHIDADKAGDELLKEAFGKSYMSWRGNDIAELTPLLEEVRGKVTALPTAAERDQVLLLRDMASVIERAEAHPGFHVAAALMRAEMQRLSENALTHQPDAPAAWTDAPEVAGNGEIRNS